MAIQADFRLYCRKRATKMKPPSKCNGEPLFRSSAALQNAYPLHESRRFFSGPNLFRAKRKKWRYCRFQLDLKKTKSLKYARSVQFRCAQIKLPVNSTLELWCCQLLVSYFWNTEQTRSFTFRNIQKEFIRWIIYERTIIVQKYHCSSEKWFNLQAKCHRIFIHTVWILRFALRKVTKQYAF